MTPSLPLPVRIAAGLVATAVEQLQGLPRLALELPVTAVSQALQASMRVQQKVTELAIKGDRVLGVGPQIEDEPAWATFDDDVPPLRRNGRGPAVPATVSPLRPSPDSTPTRRPAAGRPAPDLFDEPGPVGSGRPTPGLVTPGPVAPGPEAPGLVVPGSEAPGPDAPGLVIPGSDAPGPDTPGLITPGLITPGFDVTAAGPAVLPGYAGLTIPQLRGKLRHLGVDDLRALLAWEQAHGDRPPYVTMLTNRISTVSAE